MLNAVVRRGCSVFSASQPSKHYYIALTTQLRRFASDLTIRKKGSRPLCLPAARLNLRLTQLLNKLIKHYPIP